MAGTFVTLVNPGYSSLFTRDLSAVSATNVSGSATANLFDPDAANPLQEGEWLGINSSYKFARASASGGALSSAGGATRITLVDHAHNVLESQPCFMYFQERGRYDAQVTKKAHCIVGPAGFEFRTKMIDCDSGDEGEKVYVAVCEDSSGRLVSALVSNSVIADSTNVDGGSAPAAGEGHWYAGVILRVHSNGDATVLFQPGFI